MSYEIDEKERAEILETEDYRRVDNKGRCIEDLAPIFLWIANAFPLSFWKFVRIGLWIVLGGMAIIEIYFLWQIAIHYWNN